MSPRYIARNSNIAARLLGDEMIVMSARDSTLFTLNPVATEICQAADGRAPQRATGPHLALQPALPALLPGARRQRRAARRRLRGDPRSTGRRLRALAVQQADISIYSHRRDVHDGVTRTPGSLERSLEAIRELRSQGVSARRAWPPSWAPPSSWTPPSRPS